MTRTAVGTPDGPDDDLEKLWSLSGSEAAYLELLRGSCTAGTVVTPLCMREQGRPVTVFYRRRPEQGGLPCPVDFFLECKPYDELLHRVTTQEGQQYEKLVSELLVRYLAVGPAKRTRRGRVSPQRLTGLAVFIAGHQRAAMCCEWRAHLAGETGKGLPENLQVRAAAGFVFAALRCRLHDFVDLLWWPVDAVLASREFSGLFVLVPTLWASVFFLRTGGVYGLADHLEDVAVVWGAAAGSILAGRKWREVKPAERKPRSKRERPADDESAVPPS